MRVVNAYVVFECDQCRIVRGSSELKKLDDERFAIDLENAKPKGFSMSIESDGIKLYCRSCAEGQWKK